MKARYYGGVVGRFISPDPMWVDTKTGENFNRYWYANNNPMKFVDPDGRSSKRRDAGRSAELFILIAEKTGLISPEMADGMRAGVTDGQLRPKGGAHGKIKGVPGKHSHHMSADAASPLSKDKGPAIIMDAEDHKKTASFGSSREAKAHRSEQKALIDKGKFDEAQGMDVKDVQSKFPGKYDEGIKQMRDYTKEIELPK